MKVITHGLLCGLAALVLSGASRLTGEEAAALAVMIETDSPPFATRNAQGEPEGFAVDLLRAVAANQGLTLRFDQRPWPDIYADFRQGHGDILGFVAVSEQRAAFLDFTVPYVKLAARLYYHEGGEKIASLADLPGRRIAVTKAGSTYEYLRRQTWAENLRTYDTNAECLRAVDTGECDAILGMQLSLDYQIKHLPLAHVVRSDLDFTDMSYEFCFAVQPGQKALLARLNRGLYALQATREQDALHEKWLGPLEPEKLPWHAIQPYLTLLTVLAGAALVALLWQRRLLLRLSQQARALQENEERLQLVFEGSQDGFWDWDVVSDRVLRSPRWAAMLGYQLDEIGQSREAYRDLVHPVDLEMIAHDEQLVHDGKDQFSLEFRMRAKNGDWKWILDRGKVVARDPVTRQPLRITGTHTDITERKQADEDAASLQRKMLETQKLESLGVMAGGIAHDFNNMLSVILGNSSLAKLEAAESPANISRLGSIITAANRAADLCRQLLAYAGKGNYSIVRLNLNELITETTRLLELSIGKQALLEFALAPTLPRIEADASQIQQIIMNLVINASEALDDQAGTIRLATSVVTRSDADPGPLEELAPGNYVCVVISDTGCGMTPEVLAKIFDPFFTTKFTGRGLGLAAVLGIVRTHRGTLKVESQAGRGSTFRIYLPVSQQQTAQPFPPSAV